MLDQLREGDTVVGWKLDRERAMIRERISAGLAAARRRGPGSQCRLSSRAPTYVATMNMYAQLGQHTAAAMLFLILLVSQEKLTKVQ